MSAVSSQPPSESGAPVPLRGGSPESTPPQPPLAGGRGAAQGDRGASAALSILQGLVDQEIQRAERIVSRARQAFALAAGFFAVVQTVAFGSFASGLISSAERSTLLWLAGGAGVLLALCGALLLLAEKARRTSHITPQQVLNVLDDEPGDGTSPEERFVEYYAGVVEEMRVTNHDRQRVAWRTHAAALLSLAVVLAELLYSFDARLSRETTTLRMM